MKYFRFISIGVIFLLVCSFTNFENPAPLFTVHVYAYGSGCSTDQNNAFVQLYIDGTPWSCYTTLNGSCGREVQTGSRITGHITYGSHHADICDFTMPNQPANVNVCLNDASCCLPNFHSFGCNFNPNIY